MIADMGLPPSPCSLFGNGLFKKFSVLNTSRALQELVGPNDSKLNMRMAENLLTISAHNFMEKWNFDPIAMKPTRGRFQWMEVKEIKSTHNEDSILNKPICSVITSNSENDSQFKVGLTLTTEIQKSNRLNSDVLDVSPVHTSVGQDKCRPSLESKLIQRRQTRVTKRTYQKSTRISRQSKLRPIISKSRQCKITEFGRQRKRLPSTSQEPDLGVSPGKKVALEAPLRA